MPGTYSQILLHIVFSTKHREAWIRPDIAERLYPYMGGIVRTLNPRFSPHQETRRKCPAPFPNFCEIGGQMTGPSRFSAGADFGLLLQRRSKYTVLGRALAGSAS